MRRGRMLGAAIAAWVGAVGCGGSSSSVTAKSTASPDAGSTDDAAPAAPHALVLAPGEVAELTVADGVAIERLATPLGTEKYVVVLASTSFATSRAEVGYAVSFDAAEPLGPSRVLTACSIGNKPWSTEPLPAEMPPSGTAVQVGATRTVTMQTALNAETIDVKAIAVGKYAVVWADVTAAHPATLDAAFVSEFLTDFENTIMPRERAVFGIESDLDKDGHIQLVFSPLTHDTAIAFFTGCDLQSSAGCPATNNGEYLYLTPPNAIEPPYNTSTAIKEILAHELSHLIHFNRKVLRNKLSDWADSGYMIEGVGGFAQDVIGFQAGNFYVTKAGLDGINTFSLADTLVDGTAYDTKRDGVLRGGSYLFVRWLYDRGGGDLANADGTFINKGGPSFLRDLIDSPKTMSGEIPVASKSTPADIGADFYTALAMSNRDAVGGVAPANPCFAYLPAPSDPVTGKQRGANVFAGFHGMLMNGPKTQPATAADGKIMPGGVEYLAVDAAAGQTEINLTVTVDAKASPRVRIGRLK